MITLIRNLASTEAGELNRRRVGHVDSLTNEVLRGIGDLQKLEALGNQIVGVLTVAALSETDDQLADFRSSSQKLPPSSARRFREPRPGARDDAGGQFGPASARLRERRRPVLLRAAGLRDRARGTARPGRESAARAAADRGRRRSGRGHADRQQGGSGRGRSRRQPLGAGERGKQCLLAMLAVWLYISRSPAPRLGTLGQSMLAIAGGNLKAPCCPPGPTRSVGWPQRSVSFVRPRSKSRNNLRARSLEARQRLVDAIESISEGVRCTTPTIGWSCATAAIASLLYPARGHHGAGDAVRERRGTLRGARSGGKRQGPRRGMGGGAGREPPSEQRRAPAPQPRSLGPGRRSARPRTAVPSRSTAISRTSSRRATRRWRRPSPRASSWPA